MNSVIHGISFPNVSSTCFFLYLFFFLSVLVFRFLLQSLGTLYFFTVFMIPVFFLNFSIESLLGYDGKSPLEKWLTGISQEAITEVKRRNIDLKREDKKQEKSTA